MTSIMTTPMSGSKCINPALVCMPPFMHPLSNAVALSPAALTIMNVAITTGMLGELIPRLCVYTTTIPLSQD